MASDAPILEVFAEAAAEAAQSLTLAGPPFLERYLEQALLAALRARLGDSAVDAIEKYFVPDWNPQPGHVDLVVRRNDGTLRLAAELKVDKVEETLWDLYKVCALRTQPGVEAGVLAIAARSKTWNSQKDCVSLFPDVAGQSRRFKSFDLFSQFRKAFADLLAGGSGRLRRVPEKIEISCIAVEPLASLPGWELRVIAVRGLPEKGWLNFIGDWPEGVEAPPPKVKPPSPQLEPPPSKVVATVNCAGYQVPKHLGAKANAWFAEHVPATTAEQYNALVVELARRGWTEDEIATRVAVHRQDEICEG